MTNESMLTPKEVATWLGVHVNTVKRLGDRGQLQFFRIGERGDRRYRPEDIRAYLDWRQQIGYRRKQRGHDGGVPEG